MTQNELSERPDTAVGTPRRNRWKLPVWIAVAVLALTLAAAGGWWFASAAPARLAANAQPSARASGQSSTDAAAKKKADDSAAFWAKVQAENQARDAQDAKVSAASVQNFVQQQMKAQGWTLFSGDLYYQYADTSQYTCGYLPCTYIHVTDMAPDGCPGGIYVAASVERGGASIGLANSFAASLSKGKDAIVKLEDTTGQGDGFQLTTLDCHN